MGDLIHVVSCDQLTTPSLLWGTQLKVKVCGLCSNLRIFYLPYTLVIVQFLLSYKAYTPNKGKYTLVLVDVNPSSFYSIFMKHERVNILFSRYSTVIGPVCTLI